MGFSMMRCARAALWVALALFASLSSTAEPTQRRAFWMEPSLVALPDPKQFGVFFELHYNLNGPVNVPSRSGSGIAAVYERTLSSSSYPSFPNLNTFLGLRLATSDTELIRSMIKGDAAIASYYQDGNLKESTRIQIQGVLDNMYAYDGSLGAEFGSSDITLRLWAPTARSVNALIYENATSTSAESVPMAVDPRTGVWSASAPISKWNYMYYLYEVQVYVPEVSSVRTNRVTDPYSVSLAVDSQKSQMIDVMNDPLFKPKGWDELRKPAMASPLDIVVYELHIRDFSVFDKSVPAEERGTYTAFEYNGLESRNLTNGMAHLRALANAGLTHIHLLPSYDLGSVPEQRGQRKDPDPAVLATFPGDSEEQQRLVGETRYIDSYNWGYDPYHFGVPDGSYAIPSQQSGGDRILAYRTMVQRLAELNLRVIQDVVYNHVFEFGQASKSVFDKIVPGYYLRTDNNGVIQQQSCCPDFATELVMVERVMVDLLAHWARALKMDGFRFDLMGFHTVANMQNIKKALAELTLEQDGVDGKGLYIYGEGWDFGSAKAKGLTIASQWNLAGTGIGTFNDKIRDAVHGGSRESVLEIRTQGFINGLSYDWNGYSYNGRFQSDLRYRTDVIRVGLAGNLQNFQFIDQNGKSQTGKSLGVGYTLSPQECITYAASHDDQSLFDLSVFKAPSSTTRDMRSRIQNLALSIVGLSQGIPFFDAGVDMLRSKSLDRNTFDSGDWFNGLDFTYQKNNFAIGMPPAWNNEERYSIIGPHLRDASIPPTSTEILKSVNHLREIIQIRKSSKLFRLNTEGDIKNRLTFFNTGPSQTDALILMQLFDDGNGLPVVDPNHRRILCAFNADKAEKRYQIGELRGLSFQLHPVLASSHDQVVRGASFDASSGTVIVPAKTTAVFVLKR